MTDQLAFAAKWWAWWSNPLMDLHPDHEFYYAITPDMKVDLNYLDLLQLRGKMGLKDIPDELLSDWPDLRVLALLKPEWLSTHLEPLSVLTLDRSILQARAQDWEKLYGVSSQEKIRSIVILHHNIPRPMLQWQDSLSRTLGQLDIGPIFLPNRAELALTILLKSFFPGFATRWAFGRSADMNKLVSSMDQIDPHHWDTVKPWLKTFFDPLVAEVNQQFHVPFFDDLDFNEEFDFRPDELEEAGLIDSTQEHSDV